MAKTVGLNCELSYNTGTFATPTWSAIGNARDVTLSLEAGEADASTRGSDGWRETIQALKDGSIEFELAADSSDAAFTAIKTAFFDGTSIDVVALDGPQATAGSQGLRMIAAVSAFSRSEPLEDTVTVSVTLKPTPNDDTTPVWYTSS
tara:strand:+ start:5868 stop:6311 length:444 start_codon:yes stop_codon:yes gene_type:complete